ELAEENLVRAVEIESAEPEAGPAHDLVLRAGAGPAQLAVDREEQNVSDPRGQVVTDMARAELVSGYGVVIAEIHVLVPAVLDQVAEVAGAVAVTSEVDEAEVARAVRRAVALQVLVDELGLAGARVRVALELRVLLVHHDRHDPLRLRRVAGTRRCGRVHGHGLDAEHLREEAWSRPRTAHGDRVVREDLCLEGDVHCPAAVLRGVLARERRRA